MLITTSGLDFGISAPIKRESRELWTDFDEIEPTRNSADDKRQNARAPKDMCVGAHWSLPRLVLHTYYCNVMQ